MSSDDWERHRPTILYLYQIDRLSLVELASHMKKYHEFDQTKTQYEYRLRNWKARKNFSRKFWQYVTHRVNKRGKKKTEVTVYGRLLSEDRIHRELVRNAHIPTASEFGKRLPSPVPPGEGIVRIGSPMIVDSRIPWPSNLPYLLLKDRVIPKLHRPKELLKQLFAFVGTDILTHNEQQGSAKSIYAASRDPQTFYQVILGLKRILPENAIEEGQSAESLIHKGDPLTMATAMLKVVLFHLSNGSLSQWNKVTEIELRTKDRFILHLVNAVWNSNRQLLSAILGDSSESSNVIKEIVFGCAVRQKSYDNVRRLLKCGIDPNLLIQTRSPFPEVQISRGKVSLAFSSPYEFECNGLKEAARTCDTYLAEILLQAGANGFNAVPRFYYSDPLSVSLAIAGDDPCKHNDVVQFLRLLEQHGALVDSQEVRCNTCGFSTIRTALNIAIAQHNAPLVQFLLGVVPRLNVLEDYKYSLNSSFVCQHMNMSRNIPFGASYVSETFTTLDVAIISADEFMAGNLLEQIVSQHKAVPLRLIRQLLMLSCMVGDFVVASKLIEQLMKRNTDLNLGWEGGFTPLAAAVWNPDNSIAELLLRSGAHVKSPQIPIHSNAPMPIHVAAYHGQTSLVQRLLFGGADCTIPFPLKLRKHKDNDTSREPDDMDCEYNESNDAGCSYGKLEYAWLLFDYRGSHLTPFQYAVKSQCLDTMKLLLPHSKDIGAALIPAIGADDNNLIDEILSREPKALDFKRRDETVLDAAVRANNMGVIERYFSTGRGYGSSALYSAMRLAIKSEDHSMVRLLVSKRQIESIDKHEASALVLALKHEQWTLVSLLLGEKFIPDDCTSFYLEDLLFNVKNDRCYCAKYDGFPWRNEYRNCEHERGRYNHSRVTPLTAAFYFGGADYVAKMLHRGYTFQMKDLVQLMRDERSQDPKIPNSVRSALWSLCPPSSLDLKLRQSLVLISIWQCSQHELRQRVKLVDTLDFSVNMSIIPFGQLRAIIPNTFDCILTPLIVAIMNGDEEKFGLILDSGVDFRPVVSHDKPSSPLSYASYEGQQGMVKMLLNRGANVDSPLQLCGGATALQWSAIRGHLVIAKLLIERGADVNAPPSKENGRTALEGAAENGKLDMVHFLLGMGASVHGKARIHYIRAIELAKAHGHVTLAAYLRQRGSRTENDDKLQHFCIDSSLTPYLAMKFEYDGMVPKACRSRCHLLFLSGKWIEVSWKEYDEAECFPRDTYTQAAAFHSSETEVYDSVDILDSQEQPAGGRLPTIGDLGEYTFDTFLDNNWLSEQETTDSRVLETNATSFNGKRAQSEQWQQTMAMTDHRMANRRLPTQAPEPDLSPRQTVQSGINEIEWTDPDPFFGAGEVDLWDI
ncbi:ankyrin repeat-containing domain protein [Nemania abortiva]|nr:ankyrin repeat-containing domain protein [Nemania abortiva]